ncbi:RES domain-containing protein [uncultured Sphingomonas sp.]|uniref:RES domain-containing protein n=1 Tax=uncultured Sphingomonas sp. TaxID=158754 RepID=UPI0035CC30C9
MSRDEPDVRTTGSVATVAGRFFRSVAADFSSDALAGSSRAGRYSRPDQPTLYLSASAAGVSAAMIAHRIASERRQILMFDVHAVNIFDLRVPQALEQVRLEAGDPFADWQAAVAAGGEPSSWRARDWIEGTGATGLIDPSRKGPGLWHLVLFSWNAAGSPSVR